MSQTDPAAYGRAWAADYDRLFEGRDDVTTVTRFLADLAPGGRVLEFGVGTGRLALPMADVGLDVTGVDASAEMLARLRGRAGAERVRLIEGDFATVEAGSDFDLVLIAFSTLFLVTDQEGQLRCLENARRHLRPGAHLVVEAFVPDHSRWDRGQNVSVGALGTEEVTVKMSVHDRATQTIVMQDVTMSPAGISLRPTRLRYVWPSELDVMALAAGLKPAERWADWTRSRFTSSSPAHVSVYRSGE